MFGLLEHMPDNRTYADRAEYLKKAVAKRRKTLKQKAVEKLGGRCQICSNCHAEVHAGITQLPAETLE